MDAVSQGEASGMGGVGVGGNRELQQETSKVEEELRRRLPIGWSTSLGQLKREFVQGRGYSEAALARALLVLQRRETVRLRNGGSQIYRSGV
jgi:DNA replication licensing factor MCM5